MAIAGSSVGSGWRRQPEPEIHDDRRDDDAARPGREDPDADLLREMIGFAAGRLMELEMGGLTGAAWGEKIPDRLVQRNGYRDRVWETRAGTVELRIPKMLRAATSPASGAAADGGEGADGGHP